MTHFGNRTPFHVEGGNGTLPKVVHFQLRPDPLARCTAHERKIAPCI